MSKRTTNLITALGVLLLAAALALFLYKRYFTGADEAGARAEVQRWYDRRFRDRVEVRRCRFVEDPAGREFDRYRCAIDVDGRPCPEPRLFSVPRKDTLAPQDFDAQPIEAPSLNRPC